MEKARAANEPRADQQSLRFQKLSAREAKKGQQMKKKKTAKMDFEEREAGCRQKRCRAKQAKYLKKRARERETESESD